MLEVHRDLGLDDEAIDDVLWYLVRGPMDEEDWTPEDEKTWLW